MELFIRDKNAALDPLRFLFDDLCINCWWFEVGDMYRRILFVGIVPLCSPHPATRASLGVVLSIASLAYFLEEKPYRIEVTNFVAVVAQYAILVTYYTALSIETGVLITFGLQDLGMGLFLLISNLLVFALVLGLGWRRFHRTQLVEEKRRYKAEKRESAASFTRDKFRTTFDVINHSSVPASHVMLFHCALIFIHHHHHYYYYYYLFSYLIYLYISCCVLFEASCADYSLILRHACGFFGPFLFPLFVTDTTLKGAALAQRSGIPAEQRFNGIPFTLRAPHDLTDAELYDLFCTHPRKKSRKQQEHPHSSSKVSFSQKHLCRHSGSPIASTRTPKRSSLFPSAGTFLSHPLHQQQEALSEETHVHEALLVVALPRCLLEPVPSHAEDPCLHLLPAEVLRAMRPTVFSSVFDEELWLQGVILLPPTSILRVYTLKEPREQSTTASSGHAPSIRYQQQCRPPLRRNISSKLTLFGTNRSASKQPLMDSLHTRDDVSTASRVPAADDPGWIFEGEDSLGVGHQFTSIDDAEIVTSVLSFAKLMVGLRIGSVSAGLSLCNPQ